MSALVPTNIHVPAHLAGRVGAGSALGNSITAGIGYDGPSYPRISLKGSRFRLVEEGNEVVLPFHQLEVVIVGANPGLTKTWFAKPWNPDDEPTAPDCQSMTGVAPDADVPHPQSATCATCPHNQWGSKLTPTGQKIKACSDSKRLAVVAADDPGSKIYLLQVTPAALKDLSKYHKELSLRGIPAEVVKTILSFDTDASFPKLKFSFGGFLDAAQQAIVDTLFGSEAVQEVTGESKAREAPQVTVAKPVMVKPALPAPPAPPAPVQEILPPEKPVISHGFGKAVTNPAPAAPPPAPRAARAVEPDPAPTAQNDDLAAAVAALMQGMDDDDDSTPS